MHTCSREYWQLCISLEIILGSKLFPSFAASMAASGCFCVTFVSHVGVSKWSTGRVSSENSGQNKKQTDLEWKSKLKCLCCQYFDLACFLILWSQIIVIWWFSTVDVLHIAVVYSSVTHSNIKDVALLCRWVLKTWHKLPWWLRPRRVSETHTCSLLADGTENVLPNQCKRCPFHRHPELCNRSTIKVG